MKVFFVNVGYGEATVLQSGGRTVVVDGGSGRAEVYRQPYTIPLHHFLTAIGVKKIDLLLITHIHEDHIGGLPEVVERFAVGEIWCNLCPEGALAPMLRRMEAHAVQDRSATLFLKALKAYARIVQLAETHAIPLRAAVDGDEIQIGSMRLTALGMDATEMAHEKQRFEEMLTASDEKLLFKLFSENDFMGNATSLACRVCEAGQAVLLSGDKVGGWNEVRRRHDLRAQVLKITHHGQRDGMPSDMLQGADPEVIVVCCDRKRTFNGADPEVLQDATRYLTQKGRLPQVFVTGMLEQDDNAGDTLEIMLADQPQCTTTSVKIYGK